MLDFLLILLVSHDLSDRATSHAEWYGSGKCGAVMVALLWW
jgi:hypothetical protein